MQVNTDAAGLVCWPAPIARCVVGQPAFGEAWLIPAGNKGTGFGFAHSPALLDQRGSPVVPIVRFRFSWYARASDPSGFL